jgi:hypothetical protein
VVGLILCVPNYVHDSMMLGEMTQSAAALVAVQGAFNWLVDRFPRWRTGNPQPAVSACYCSISTGPRGVMGLARQIRHEPQVAAGNMELTLGILRQPYLASRGFSA